MHSSSPGQNALFLQMEIFLRDKGVQNSVRLGRQTGRARRIRTPPMVSAFSHCDKEFWDCDSCIGSRTSGVSKSGRVNAPGGAAVLGLPCPNEMGGTRFDITCSPIRMFSSRKLVAVFLYCTTWCCSDWLCFRQSLETGLPSCPAPISPDLTRV